ncbi:MAG: SDR family oxidoreductase [Bacteroidota bacterium]
MKPVYYPLFEAQYSDRDLMVNKKTPSPVVWITGASSGIGEALAYEYNRRGARLILSARRRVELERVRAASPYPESIELLPLDLTRLETHESVARKAIDIYGQIDLLINNGGISQRGLAHETTTEVVRQVMEVNFFGTIHLTRQLLPHMMERRSGHIVVMSSVMGKFGTRLRSAYAASKHALHGWYDCLRQEVAVHNVDVTLVCPGYVRTNVTYNAMRADGSSLNEMGMGQMNGMDPEYFAKTLIPKLEKRKREIYIGGKEVWAVRVKRWFPGLLDAILRRVRVT